ncbi:Uncharacterised protein [Escherichia coli]|nr:Uncharacterised protein [Escherichia coli]
MKLIIFILIVLIIAAFTYPDYPQKCKSAFSFC